MNYCLKFQNKSDADSVLMDGENQRYKNIDVIGVIYKSTGTVLANIDGTEYHEMTPLPGWHVNVWVLPDEDATALQPYVITPTNPVRVWG